MCGNTNTDVCGKTNTDMRVGTRTQICVWEHEHRYACQYSKTHYLIATGSLITLGFCEQEQANIKLFTANQKGYQNKTYQIMFKHTKLIIIAAYETGTRVYSHA
jgi:hypothetical protein